MHAVRTPTKMSPEEYSAWVQKQQEKHEYIGGEVFAMTGAGRAQNLIVGNSVVRLRQGLRGKPCSVHVADLKLQIHAASACVYPDLMVTCDPRDAGPEADSCIRHP